MNEGDHNNDVQGKLGSCIEIVQEVSYVRGDSSGPIRPFRNLQHGEFAAEEVKQKDRIQFGSSRPEVGVGWLVGWITPGNFQSG